MEATVLALTLGAAVGLVMALTGAGGGVLALPLLVLGLHLTVQQAAPVGLLAVGLAAALGAVLGLREGIVRYRAAALMGLSGMLVAPVGVFLAHRLPNRPLLAVFALVLVFTAWRVLKRPVHEADDAATVACRVAGDKQQLTWTPPCARALAGTGLIAGFLSGLLGVGGGFVIIPSLLSHTNLTVRSVQATSLAVIALVSLSGIAASVWHGAFPWTLALPFSVGAVVALLLGKQMAKALEPGMLQKAFAWFSLLVAGLMLARALGWLTG